MSGITTTALAALLTLVPLANAHIGVWHPSMFCANGPRNEVNWNANTVVGPMYDLPFSDFWFGNGRFNGVSNHCYNWPPPAGQFLELPAGGSFEVEFANNRAFSSMSQFGSKGVGRFPDGQDHPEYDQPGYSNPACIASPLLHTQDRAHVAGSVFAISYHSDYASVTPENMVVFSAAYDTPWHSKGTFHVPADLPACPPGGCLCGWGWLPDNCGQPNEYFQLFRCKVTGAKPDAPAVAPAKPAVWCQDHPERCTKGAKQMIIWHQAERNNIAFTGTGRAGEQDDLQQLSPGYNMKMGFANGAQNDIFVTSTQHSSPPVVGSKPPPVVVISQPPPSKNGTSTKPHKPEHKHKHKPEHKHKHKPEHKHKHKPEHKGEGKPEHGHKAPAHKHKNKHHHKHHAHHHHATSPPKTARLSREA